MTVSDDYQDSVLIPGLVGNDIPTYNWDLSTVPQIYMDGVCRNIPQGKVLGGGTVINGFLWNRGGQGDYNGWAALGNPGWDWDSMVPYFMKVYAPRDSTYPIYLLKLHRALANCDTVRVIHVRYFTGRRKSVLYPL